MINQKKDRPDVVFIGYPPIEISYVMARWLYKQNIPYILDIKDQWPDLIIEIFPKKEVIFELLSSLIFILLLDMKLKRVGSRLNVTMKDVIKPKVIIQPKSIIGLIPLKIKDRKAHTVVNTV